MTDITEAETEGEVREYVEETGDVVKMLESGDRPVWFLLENADFTIVLEDGERSPPKGDHYEFSPHQEVVGTVERSDVPEAPNGSGHRGDGSHEAPEAPSGPSDGPSDVDDILADYDYETVGEVFDGLEDGEAFHVVGAHPLAVVRGTENSIGELWFVKEDGERTIVRKQGDDVDVLDDRTDDDGLPPALEAETVDAEDAPEPTAESGPTAFA